MSKATLKIPSENITMKFEQLNIYHFQPLRRYFTNSPFPEVRASGKPIILITSNMPEQLKNQIVSIIENYCDHLGWNNNL